MANRHLVDDSCVALYRLDEPGVADLPQDASGNGFHMTVQGGGPGAGSTTSGYSMDVETGLFLRCRDLYCHQANVGPRYLQVDDTVGTRFEAQTVTLAGWIYLSEYANPGWWCYYGKQNGYWSTANWSYVIRSYYTGGKYYWLHGINYDAGGGGTFAYVLTEITSLGWHHVGLTYSNATTWLRGYVNGVNTASWENTTGNVNLKYDAVAATANFMVGGLNLVAHDYADDVVVYDEVKGDNWFATRAADAPDSLFSLSALSMEFAQLGMARKAVEQAAGSTLAAHDSLLSLSALSIEHEPIGILRPMGTARSGS